jgi:hypothetical protein
MSFADRFRKHGGEPERGRAKRDGVEIQNPEMDPVVDQALRDFRSSVQAWSDAAYRQPRLVEIAPRRTVWRMAAAWALGSVLVAGGAWGGILEHQHRQEQDRLARLRQQEFDRRLQEQKAREAELELAQVDSDVSREVPDALEPLVPSMTADEAQ